MTDRVDFYVLQTTTAKQRLHFACRLTEKAYLRDLRIVILTDGMADAEALDDLLWTFSERAFVPHSICRGDQGADAGTPVQLVPGAIRDGADLLVNLSTRLPEHAERFTRIAEIIDSDVERRRLGRERFKSYRELKLTPQTHQLDDADSRPEHAS